MRHRRKITLFVPDELSSDGSVWRRYVISHVTLMLRSDGGSFSGELYIFDRCCAAYLGAVRCMMPKIFPGCAVLTTADMFDETEYTSLPEGCLRVLSSERFDGGEASHVKLCLG